jgi:GT2 family glycosyltransferase
VRVAAIVVTFNRVEVLQRTLEAIRAQIRTPDAVLVVDNASTDGTPAFLAGQFPDVETLRLDHNTGYGAGLAAGMRARSDRGDDAYWLMDDDSQPRPAALARLMQALEDTPHLGYVGLRGGSLRAGYVRHIKAPGAILRRPKIGPGVRAVDFALVDGALVPEDLFMMLEDIDYTFRIRRAGLALGVLEEDLMRRENLGSRGEAGRKPLWRSYYKSRNHVRIALESGSAVMVAGCVARQLRLLTGCILARDRRGLRIRRLLEGCRDGLLGRMGRTLEPDSG